MGMSGDADGFGEMQLREPCTTPPTLNSRGSGWSHDLPLNSPLPSDKEG